MRTGLAQRVGPVSRARAAPPLARDAVTALSLRRGHDLFYRDRDIMSRSLIFTIIATLGWASPGLAQAGAPGDLAIETPAIDARDVYVAQVGNGNAATIGQRSAHGRIEAQQRGDSNRLDVAQTGSGTTYAKLSQTGDANNTRVRQDGTGPTALLLAQNGNSNQARVEQATVGSLYNSAAIAQSGTGNTLSLAQSGEDNRAVLSQQGDDNRMSAVQNGTGNRLAWVQDGSGLPDLGIVQSGGAAVTVTQSGGR